MVPHLQIPKNKNVLIEHINKYRIKPNYSFTNILFLNSLSSIIFLVNTASLGQFHIHHRVQVIIIVEEGCSGLVD